MARTLGAGAASIVLLAGTITAFGAAITALDSAPAAAALTCNDNWTGGAGTSDWNTATNWSNGVPASSGASDNDACISGGATVVIPNAAISINELTVSSGSTLTVGVSGGTTAATLSVASGLENDGTLTAGPSGSGFAGLTLNGSITNTGSLTTDGSVVVGSSTGSTVTNQGTWTTGTAATTTIGGSSSFTQSGSGAQLSDTNVTGDTSTADNGSFSLSGSLIVNGGTICGTAPDLHGGSVGGDTLVFGSSPPAGPACTAGLAIDQIALGSGTNTLSGGVPAGYTLSALGGATLEPTVALTNNGAVVLNPGAFSDNTSGATFTNAGTFDVPANASGSTLNALAFTNTGAFSVEGKLTVGNSFGSFLTNEGTWTLGTGGTQNNGGSSSFTQSGTGAQLSDTNVTGDTATADNDSFNVAGSLVVDGGTICGTAPDLQGGSVGGDSLRFGSSPPAGPACTAGLAVDQIALGAGTNTLSGDVPAGYTVTALGGATLEPTVALTNNGAVALDPGAFSDNTSGATFTNAGTFDVPANANGSTLNALAFTNASTGTFSVEGKLTVGNSFGSFLTNQGTWTLGTGGTQLNGGSSAFTQSGSSAQLSDANVTGNTATTNNDSFAVDGSLVVDGGTICGTAPQLHGGSVGGDTLVFGSSPPAGPACGTGLATDQIAFDSGTNTLSGDIPTGYTLTALNGGTLEPTVTATNNGAVVFDYGTFTQSAASTTFTNAGTFDVPANANGTTFNAIAFTNGPTGTFSVEGKLTVGNSFGSALTNQGTWTLGTGGTQLNGGSSSFTQDGLLTDNNTSGNSATTNNDSFAVEGSLVVDGGTICGTAPQLHGGSVGGDTLRFGSGPIPGPSCAAGVAEDQIAFDSGTNTLTGDIPAGYTLTGLNGGTLEPNTTLANDGSIIFDFGGFYDNTSGTTFTNAGTIDVPANASGSTLNALAFANAATGTFNVEGTLTIGNSFGSAVTNDGTIGVAPGGLINVGGSSSITNETDGLLAFGISGLPTSTANYGRVTNGTLSLGGTADPVFDNGFTPPSGTEYFVYTGTRSGTFATVLHNASADYTHAGEVGLTGGAPATPTTTSVASSVPGGSVFGQGVQFTATVTPSSGSNPSGSVAFSADGIYLGSAPVVTSAGVSTASLDVTSLRVGSEAITATYSGDVVFDASTSTTLTQVVSQDAPTVSITPSPASPVPGQQVTYTASVVATAPGAGTPTGDVSLTDNGTPIPGCQNLVMGPIGPSFVTCSVTYSSTGAHSIGASYAGDTDFSAATGSLSLTVQPAATSLALVSSANPGPLGAPITYTATVSVVAPGTGTPTGTVSFTDQGSPVTGCQSLSLPASAPHQVTCTETYTVNTDHSIVATYSGDANDASSHDGLVETLQQIGTTTTVGSSTPTSTYGQSVTFTATITPTASAGVNPTGTVTFTDNGSTDIGTVVVSTTGGVTTGALAISNLGAGTHSVSATYSGDSTFSTSSTTTSAALSVAQATTTLGLASTANPSVVGQTVTFTATISSSTTGETGTVQFADGGTPIGSGTVSGGQATLQTSSLTLGTHPITAVYEGDANFVGSSAPGALSQAVDQAATSTAVTSDHNPGTVGQTITYTATVVVDAPGAGTPTTTVSFSDDGNPITGCQSLTLPASAPLQVTCAQSYTTNTGHSITATYAGDSNFAGSTSSPLTETLSQVSTTTSVMAAPGAATFGQSVTLTATVAPTSGTANPTGSVTFTDNGTTTLGTSTLSTTAGVTTASILVTTLPVGTDLISASYSPGAGFLASATTTSASVAVSQATTTLGLLSNANPSTFGQSVTFTATVFPATGSGETGTVTFFDNGTSIGTGGVSNGQTTLTTSVLAIGTHPVTATYTGDGNFVGSSTTTTLSQVVNKAPTSLGLASSLNPSLSGQSVTFTATITPVTGSGETGTVTFFDNGTSIGTGGVSGGTATLSTSTLAVGSHPITASYGGDGNFASSSTTSAISQVVNKVPTSLALASSVNPSTFGQSVTFTATVTPATGSGETGTVTFFDNGTSIGSGGVSGGQATFATSTLALGTHPITATYGGDGNFASSSTTSTLSQVVGSSQAATVTSLTSSVNPSTVGQTPTLMATVTLTTGGGTGGGGGGGPDNFTGTVTFYEGATTLGTSPVAASGVATMSLPQLASTYAIGTHSFTATYSGSTLYVGSTSAPYSQVVAPPIFITSSDGANFGIANSANDSYRTVLTSASSCSCSSENFLAVTPDGTRAYVMQPTPTATRIYAVNTATGAIMASISLPYRAEDLTMAPNGANLYVAESVPGEVVAVISTSTNTVTRNISIGLGPNGTAEAMAINPTGTELAITQDTVVTMVNLTTNSVTANIPLGGSEGVTFSPNGSTVYVTNGFLGGGGFGANTVSAISTATNTVTRTYSGMTEPIAVAVTPDGTQLFVANVGTYNAGGGHYVTTPYVAAINTASGTETNYMQTNIPENVSVSPDGKSVYIADYATGQVGILNAATHAVVGTITVGALPDTVKAFGDTAPTPPPPPPPVTVTSTGLPAATQNLYYETTLTAANGLSPYTWSLAGGSLPTGLSLLPSGIITGTPTATATTSTFTVSVADSEYPASTATATFTLSVAAASTAPPPCGGEASEGYPSLPPPLGCASGSNTTPGGTATATTSGSAGTVSVTAHGTGGITVGEYVSAPSDVPFRAASNSFDLALSSSNTFTSVTVVDCALAGATQLMWWNAAANGGAGAWQTVSPAVYNPRTRCLTITFSATSSPTLAQLTGTPFAGVLPAETVSISTGGSSPYSLSGTVLSGAITITPGQSVTQVSGSVVLDDASGNTATVTVNAACLFGVCAGTFSVSDPAAGVSFTTPVTATFGQVNANQAGGQGFVFPGPGLKNAYPLSWNVTVATS